MITVHSSACGTGVGAAVWGVTACTATLIGAFLCADRALARTQPPADPRADDGSPVALRRLQTACADGAAATARLVYNGQARRAMFVKFLAGLVHRLVYAAARGRRSHDLFDPYFRGKLVVRGHAAAHVALGDHTDQLEVLRVLDHRRAAVAS